MGAVTVQCPGYSDGVWSWGVVYRPQCPKDICLYFTRCCNANISSLACRDVHATVKIHQPTSHMP